MSDVGIKRVFIETGTFLGDTAAREEGSNNWEHLHTIEIDEKLFRAAERRFKKTPRITCHLGSSPDVLSKIIEPECATHFYLDAHRTGTNEQARAFTGTEFTRHDTDIGECPVLEELAVIFAFDWRVPPTIIIDDAQNFVPGEGFWKRKESRYYDPAQWPTMDQIAHHLQSYKMSVVDDPRKRNTAIVATVRR